MRKLWFIIPVVAIAAFAVLSPEEQPVVRATDDGVVMRTEKPSPDGQHVALAYQFNTGSFGYSRMWWAVVPAAYEHLNLAEYELPDRYRTTGWATDGGLLVEEWEPYYYPDGDAVLATGDSLHGVRLHVSRLAESEGRQE